MSRESLNYFLEALPHSPICQQTLQSNSVEYSTDELVEEVWLTTDKDDAKCLLETFGSNLSEYQWTLLDEILFGLVIAPQYVEKNSWNVIKLLWALDK